MRWLYSIILLAPWIALANVENAGIVDGIWLSDPQPVENQAVRIYVAVHNTTADDLEGTVHFRVNDELLDTMRINALDGRIVESWADWVPAAGTSTITVNLRRTELESTASGTRPVEVVTSLTERAVFIEPDTDGDGIGNQADTDDDNDGVSDSEEVAAGSDPLVYNEPPPEPESTTDVESSTSEAVSAQPTANAQASRSGLETFLDEDNPVHTALTRTTDSIVANKQKLDDYRKERHDSAQNATSSAQDTGGWFSNIMSSMYSVGLALLSWLLAYPGLVQLLFLLLALYILYRFARHFGRRPDY